MAFPFVVAVVACKKQAPLSQSVQLQSLEYRIVVADPNIKDIGFDAKALDKDGKGLASNYHQFRNITLFDTLIFKLEASPGIELLHSVRQLQVMIQHKSKVYSPLRASQGVIIEGNPYEAGWHYTRWYNLKQPDTVKTQGERVFYIHLQADTSKFTEF